MYFFISLYLRLSLITVSKYDFCHNFIPVLLFVIRFNVATNLGMISFARVLVSLYGAYFFIFVRCVGDAGLACGLGRGGS